MKRNTAIIAIAGLLMASAVYGQSAVLPPITMSGHGGAPQQMSLPPISRTQMAPATARNTALPSINQAPVVRSRSGAPQQAYRQPQQYQAKGAQLIQSRGNDVYSQQSINLPPVTTLPVPSRTALPPLYSDTLMTVPLDEAVTRVLGCNMLGFTGLTNTVSADVSKAGSFKMGFHSSWFDLERIYDRSLATNESGEKLELPLFFNYALTDDLEAVFNIPIIDYTAKSREIWTRDLSESGVGDMKLGFKYRVFDNAEYQMRGAFGVAFKFPTGSDDKMLGTGKTDFEIFTAFSKNFEKIVGHLNLGYIMTGDPNNQFYPDGLADKFYYNLGIEYPHTHNVTVMAEVAGEDWGSCGMKV
ncbi:MAG: transporter, partial [Candidatus Riflebacteria bacterium]|nr:transporter [Candidatus Riflebacteria bacterium]